MSASDARPADAPGTSICRSGPAAPGGATRHGGARRAPGRGPRPLLARRFAVSPQVATFPRGPGCFEAPGPGVTVATSPPKLHDRVGEREATVRRDTEVVG